ncbi:hypothetical protein [Lysobacter gummosus]|uniref:hypothetical protein n=1 Tax=Lysobacter gummosus TaxID=262324 RepID=UPI0036254675
MRSRPVSRAFQTPAWRDRRRTDPTRLFYSPGPVRGWPHPTRLPFARSLTAQRLPCPQRPIPLHPPAQTISSRSIRRR